MNSVKIGKKKVALFVDSKIKKNNLIFSKRFEIFMENKLKLKN